VWRGKLVRKGMVYKLNCKSKISYLTMPEEGAGAGAGTGAGAGAPLMEKLLRSTK
jgi:hypothetical protein